MSAIDHPNINPIKATQNPASTPETEAKSVRVFLQL
jgi:hypothetical protein